MSLASRSAWVFDMDGTLTVAAHDFAAIKRTLGLPTDRPILESMQSLPTNQRVPLEQRLQGIEQHMARSMRAQPYAEDALRLLKQKSCRLGVVTRNSKANALVTLKAAGLLGYFRDDDVLGRDCCLHKPAPDGPLKLLRAWGKSAADGVMVGDYVFDLQSGRAAGISTVHFDVTHQEKWPEYTDLHVHSFSELIEHIRDH